MSAITITAKTLDLALVRAAGQLGISSNNVAHKIKQESAGFLGIGKKIIIEAWNKADGRPRAARSTKDYDQSERVEISTEKREELKTELKEFLEGTASLAIGEPVKVTVNDTETRFILNIDSEYLATQFARNSKLAESFEHLLRKKPRHLRQELPFRVFVDAGGVRINREIELAEVAKEFSDKVFTEKKPIVLNYRSSYDRKVIHMTLDQDDRVYTKSIGKGPNRKLMILPSKDDSAETEA